MPGTGVRNFSVATFFICVIIFSGPGTAAGANGHGHNHNHSQAAVGVSKPVMKMSLSPLKPETGEPVTISLSITDEKGEPVQDLTVSHERLIHVVIVSEDFSAFSHIHPEEFGPVTDEMKRTATFNVKYTFPKAGRYLIAADYATKDSHFSEQFPLQVSGGPAMGEINRDFSLNRSFGEYNVSVRTAPAEIRSGEKTILKFRIMKDSTPVTDLRPYLAAPMHLAIIRTDLNQFVHAHADQPDAAPHPAGHVHATKDETYGPELESEVVFPVPGTYKLFSQVNHKGKVLLFDFLVRVL
jgi:hypothetical protein